MAVGTVSSSSSDVWQLIGTNTLTSGTSSSFTGISGYKTLMLVVKGVTTAASSYLTFRVNNDSTTGNYSLTGGADNNFLVATNSGTRGAGLIIYDVNQDVPHKVEATVYNPADGVNIGFYTNPVAITRVDLVSRESQAFTAGTFYLYGIAA